MGIRLLHRHLVVLLFSPGDPEVKPRLSTVHFTSAACAILLKTEKIKTKNT